MCFDADFLQQVRETDSPGARLIAMLHQDARVTKLIQERHLRMWDETVALYLAQPALGEIRKSSGKPPVFGLVRWD